MEIIKHYHNPSLSISIIEANEIIGKRKSTIKNKKEHYGFCFDQQKIEDEIHYYERTIFSSDKEEIRLLKQRVSKLEEILIPKDANIC
jgi:hypothetical protein